MPNTINAPRNIFLKIVEKQNKIQCTSLTNLIFSNFLSGINRFNVQNIIIVNNLHISM